MTKQNTHIENLDEYDPCLLYRDSNGFYYRAKSLEIERYSNDNIKFRYIGDSQALKLGLDIIEVPTRGISLIARCNNDPLDEIMTAYNETRKFAELCRRDYFGFEEFGSKSPTQMIEVSNGKLIIEIRPRLFSKNN